MAGEVDELRGRVARAGWTELSFRENGLEVEGKVLDVTRGTLTKAHLRAHFVRIGACVDGDFVDRIERVGPLVAERRIGPTKLRVEVLDTDRAREELARLEPLLHATTFRAAVDLVGAGGFVVDRDASREETYDSFSWTLRARRDGEHLDVHVRFGASSFAKRGVLVDRSINGFGQAELQTASASMTVAVLSLARAEELLGVLAGTDGP